jgi:hypothetical protein
VALRLLSLLLALCAALPVQAWARLAEACEERDRCCCRRDEKPTDTGPIARRQDCCEAPCDRDTAPCPAVTPRGTDYVAVAVTLRRAEAVPDSVVGATPLPRARVRGPPVRVHLLVQHWLI